MLLVTGLICAFPFLLQPGSVALLSLHLQTSPALSTLLSITELSSTSTARALRVQLPVVLCQSVGQNGKEPGTLWFVFRKLQGAQAAFLYTLGAG